MIGDLAGPLVTWIGVITGVTFIWISAAVFAAMMTLTFASLTLVYLFWESARLAVLGGLTAFFAAVWLALYALGLLCVGTLPQALQRAEASHVGSAAVACVGFLPLGLVHLGRLARSSARRTSALGAVIAAVAALAAPAVLRPALDYGERSLGVITSHWIRCAE